MGIIQNHNTPTHCTMNKNIALACISTALLCGCANSFLKPTEGSERVLLLNTSQVANCKSLGKISVNVVTKVGIYTREANAVEANLLQLGQNNAIELGGDSLVKDVTPEFGKQVFAVYKCKR
jgi:Domain of unknown function (DUF4156)